MTTPTTDSLKAAPATRPVEIELAEPISSAPEISLGRGLPEGVQRFFAGMLLVPAFMILLSIRLVWFLRGIPGPFFFWQERGGAVYDSTKQRFLIVSFVSPLPHHTTTTRTTRTTTTTTTKNDSSCNKNKKQKLMLYLSRHK